MTHVVIIADDLSGAADCAVGFAVAGFATAVTVDAAVAADAEVVATTTDTRNVTPVCAAQTVASTAGRLITRPGQIVYKKIDSTLRGNIAVELAAVRERVSRVVSRAGRGCGARPPVSIVAPAFPDTCRTTSGGRQYVKDVPVEQTEMGRGLDASHGSIPRLLEAAIPSVGRVGIDAVRSGESALHQTFEAHIRRGFDTLVCDAERAGDLQTIAGAGCLLDHPVLWVGSGGLARELARTLPPAGARNPARAGMPAVSGSIVDVVGSHSGIARTQVDALASGGEVGVLRVPATALRAGRGSGRWDGIRKALERYLDDARDIVVTVADESEAAWSPDASLCAGLAQLVAPSNARIGALVLSGGDTARAVLDTLGIRELRLLGEVEPGTVIARAGDGGASTPVILKAGAFGDERTLIRCHDFLRASREPVRER